jgi:hypothetical protein
VVLPPYEAFGPPCREGGESVAQREKPEDTQTHRDQERSIIGEAADLEHSGEYGGFPHEGGFRNQRDERHD